MDQSTHEVRRKQWLSIITECQARPEDLYEGTDLFCD